MKLKERIDKVREKIEDSPTFKLASIILTLLIFMWIFLTIFNNFVYEPVPITDNNVCVDNNDTSCHIDSLNKSQLKSWDKDLNPDDFYDMIYCLARYPPMVECDWMPEGSGCTEPGPCVAYVDSDGVHVHNDCTIGQSGDIVC